MSKLNLEKLDGYYRMSRRRGHTTAMLNGAKSDKNILVIIAHEAQKGYIDLPKEQLINMNSLDKLKGRINPVLVDNYAIQLMWGEVKEELDKKDIYIEKLEKEIRYYEKVCNK